MAPIPIVKPPLAPVAHYTPTPTRAAKGKGKAVDDSASVSPATADSSAAPGSSTGMATTDVTAIAGPSASASSSSSPPGTTHEVHIPVKPGIASGNMKVQTGDTGARQKKKKAKKEEEEKEEGEISDSEEVQPLAARLGPRAPPPRPHAIPIRHPDERHTQARPVPIRHDKVSSYRPAPPSVNPQNSPSTANASAGPSTSAAKKVASPAPPSTAREDRYERLAAGPVKMSKSQKAKAKALARLERANATAQATTSTTSVLLPRRSMAPSPSETSRSCSTDTQSTARPISRQASTSSLHASPTQIAGTTLPRTVKLEHEVPAKVPRAGPSSSAGPSSTANLISLPKTIQPATPGMTATEIQIYMISLRNLLERGATPEMLVTRGATAKYVSAVCQQIVTDSENRKAQELWSQPRETRSGRDDSGTPTIPDSRSGVLPDALAPVGGEADGSVDMDVDTVTDAQEGEQAEMNRSLSAHTDSSAEESQVERMMMLSSPDPPRPLVLARPMVEVQVTTTTPNQPAGQAIPVSAAPQAMAQAVPIPAASRSSEQTVPIPVAPVTTHVHTLSTPSTSQSSQHLQAMRMAVSSWTPTAPPSGPRSHLPFVPSPYASALQSAPTPSSRPPVIPERSSLPPALAASLPPLPPPPPAQLPPAPPAGPAPGQSVKVSTYRPTSAAALRAQLISATPMQSVPQTAAAGEAETAAQPAASTSTSTSLPAKAPARDITAALQARTAMLEARRKAMESMKAKRQQVRAATIDTAAAAASAVPGSSTPAVCTSVAGPSSSTSVPMTVTVQTPAEGTDMDADMADIQARLDSLEQEQQLGSLQAAGTPASGTATPTPPVPVESDGRMDVDMDDTPEDGEISDDAPEPRAIQTPSLLATAPPSQTLNRRKRPNALDFGSKPTTTSQRPFRKRFAARLRHDLYSLNVDAASDSSDSEDEEEQAIIVPERIEMPETWEQIASRMAVQEEQRKRDEAIAQLREKIALKQAEKLKADLEKGSRLGSAAMSRDASVEGVANTSAIRKAAKGDDVAEEEAAEVDDPAAMDMDPAIVIHNGADLLENAVKQEFRTAEQATSELEQQPRFQAYQPVLPRYPRLAQLPVSSRVTTTPTADSTTTGTDNKAEFVNIGLLNEIVLTRRLMADPDLVICAAEVGGGACADAGCGDLHLGRFAAITEDDMVEYASHQFPKMSAKVVRTAVRHIASSLLPPPSSTSTQNSKSSAGTTSEQERDRAVQALAEVVSLLASMPAVAK